MFGDVEDFKWEMQQVLEGRALTRPGASAQRGGRGTPLDLHQPGHRQHCVAALGRIGLPVLPRGNVDGHGTVDSNLKESGVPGHDMKLRTSARPLSLRIIESRPYIFLFNIKYSCDTLE